MKRALGTGSWKTELSLLLQIAHSVMLLSDLVMPKGTCVVMNAERQQAPSGLSQFTKELSSRVSDAVTLVRRVPEKES